MSHADEPTLPSPVQHRLEDKLAIVTGSASGIGRLDILHNNAAALGETCPGVDADLLSLETTQGWTPIYRRTRIRTAPLHARAATNEPRFRIDSGIEP